mmetsp:Transcript_7940/g.14317  ORF Transcript_7940/g.14317 Transcript_7940/m.14317 type:complete len:86 (-) Transcript_7940:61-318(-)
MLSGKSKLHDSLVVVAEGKGNKSGIDRTSIPTSLDPDNLKAFRQMPQARMRRAAQVALIEMRIATQKRRKEEQKCRRKGETSLRA